MSREEIANVQTKSARWTDEQWKAIVTQGTDLLISAAAGSGKTAVLVERLIMRMTDESTPLLVDEVLVATFTKAAADEMKQRIRAALETKLLEDPDSELLRRQLAFIHRASITTLHSFCLEIIQQSVHLLELDPAFRIANETEADLLQQDALEEILEEFYENNDENSAFWHLVDAFGGDRGDDALVKLILQIYDYAQSHPEPKRWMEQMANDFTIQDTKPRWLPILMNDLSIEIQTALDHLKNAYDCATAPNGPHAYAENLTAEIDWVNRLFTACEQEDWDQLQLEFQQGGFGRLKAQRGEVDETLQEMTKSERDTAKEIIAQLQEPLFTKPLKEHMEDMWRLGPIISELVQLVKQFMERYAQKKLEKSLVDFSDLEHYALQILRNSEDSSKPSDIAMAYQQRFKEVFIDEYQDTNQVQESIVTFISRTGREGNRFMVGDVKQSIYRFRLAEPALFLQKSKAYDEDNEDRTGLRIDLTKNFRSRSDVLHSINFIFRQLMGERVAEISYDPKAELVCGAEFPDPHLSGDHSLHTDFLILDESELESDHEEGAGIEADPLLLELKDLKTAEIEARTIVKSIREMMGGEEGKPLLIIDGQTKQLRPIQYRDIVILLRSPQSWASTLLDEFRRLGIPAYAELNTGYFAAIEIEVMMSLLKVIDNPDQDIPLASVLRSPMYGLTADQLALIRVHGNNVGLANSFFAAVQHSAKHIQSSWRDKLQRFLTQLNEWRTLARQNSLSALIATVFRDTGYYDYVHGLPSGVQRQANLRALYDRARQYEQTTLRGLFRFLRFIERMREQGVDLGTARALGEQENVVRLMSIHKSKGLEFPVVFVAGLGKMFNQMDLMKPFLLHKELGFGPKMVDLNLKISYPSLPMIAIRKRSRLEMLAEELRVLYVALTRAKEKLILVGTVKNLQKKLEKWTHVSSASSWLLPDSLVAGARTYLDWMIPALLRHRDSELLRQETVQSYGKLTLLEDSSRFNIEIVPYESLEFGDVHAEFLDSSKLALLQEAKPLHVRKGEQYAEIRRRLSWRNPYEIAATRFSKTSVTEMKRLRETIEGHFEERNYELYERQMDSFQKRPKFIEKRGLNAAERGVAYHTLMQHLPFQDGAEQTVEETLNHLISRKLITLEQASVIDLNVIQTFIKSEIGQKMIHASQLEREVPFSIGLPAKEVYTDWDDSLGEEVILMQGMIDCLFLNEDKWYLVDYKTNAIYGNRLQQLKEQYRFQVELYARAIEQIRGIKLAGKSLYFFDGGHLVHYV